MDLDTIRINRIDRTLANLSTKYGILGKRVENIEKHFTELLGLMETDTQQTYNAEVGTSSYGGPQTQRSPSTSRTSTDEIERLLHNMTRSQGQRSTTPRTPVDDTAIHNRHQRWASTTPKTSTEEDYDKILQEFSD